MLLESSRWHQPTTKIPCAALSVKQTVARGSREWLACWLAWATGHRGRVTEQRKQGPPKAVTSQVVRGDVVALGLVCPRETILGEIRSSYRGQSGSVEGRVPQFLVHFSQLSPQAAPVQRRRKPVDAFLLRTQYRSVLLRLALTMPLRGSQR